MVATVSTLGPASSTVGYYARDDLCRADDPFHYRASRWYGRGCEILNLGSHVDPGPFAAVLGGRTSEGAGDRIGVRDRPPGLDITFSAPKTVSLSALLCGDPRVVRAHDKAVRATLRRVEQRLLFISVRAGGGGRLVPAPGLVAATFRHHVNRNHDPQLHTHAVVANLAPGTRHGPPLALPVLRRHALLIGAWYRNELARRLEGDGYVVMPVRRGGLAAFEVLGWPQQTRAVFSSRRSEILDWIRERGWSRNAGTMRRAALATRRGKNEPVHADLVSGWKRRAREHGLALAPEPAVRIGAGGSAIAVTRAVAAELGARQPVFRHQDLVAGVLGHAPGRFDPDDLEAVIAALAGDGHLVERTRAFGARAWSSAGEDAAGATMLRIAQAGTGVAPPLAVRARVAATVRASGLTRDQGRALAAMVLGRDRTLAFRIGSRGGKTGLLRALRGLLPGRPVIGLVPARDTAAAMVLETGVPVRSLDRFLARAGGAETGWRDLEGSILVLDGAARVSPGRLLALVRTADELAVGRLVLMADARDCVAKGAGQVFQSLAGAGVTVLRIDDGPRMRRDMLQTADREDLKQGNTLSARRSAGGDGPEPPHRWPRRSMARLLSDPVADVEGRRDGHHGSRPVPRRAPGDPVRTVRAADKEPVDRVPPRVPFAGATEPGPGEWLRRLVGADGLDLSPPAQAVALRVLAAGPRSGWREDAARILRRHEPPLAPAPSAVRRLAAVLVGARAEYLLRTGECMPVRRRELPRLARELTRHPPGPGAAFDERVAWRTACRVVRRCMRGSGPRRDVRVADGPRQVPVEQVTGEHVRRGLAGEVERLLVETPGRRARRAMRTRGAG